MDATHLDTDQAAPAQRPTPLPLRNDTLLGVCEAIGRDFGFHPNFLRIALSLGLFVSPVAMIVIYLGLGAVVAVSRLLFPDRSIVLVAPDQSTPAKSMPEEPQRTLAA